MPCVKSIAIRGKQMHFCCVCEWDVKCYRCRCSHIVRPCLLVSVDLQSRSLQPVANSEPCIAVSCPPQVNLSVTGYFCASVTACRYEDLVFALCIETLSLVRPLAPIVVDGFIPNTEAITQLLKCFLVLSEAHFCQRNMT